ncbi:MAG: cellulase family glycosylhydrolase [Thermomicrobium sp.]|nr:cellulase family glycosylhydrolase [Thermomicrobium sp.]MDW7982892.1 cellulase family glycosylhydrolase [Thermomicrobium sp.]
MKRGHLSRIRRERLGHWILVVLHLAVISGLVCTMPLSIVAHRMAVRGIETGEDSAPIPLTDVNPLGINTFLQAEPDPERVARMLDMIAAAGFSYIRQPFFWYEIEPEPGVFWDTKWNVSTWEKYDRIVRLARERGLEIIARLDKPPRWAREGQPMLDECPDGPPTRTEDYARFVQAVVRRYQGQIRYVQIWNEPNLRNEWGCQPIDPVAFTRLLEVAYRAAKDADPNVLVLMPGLAPTDQTGPENLSDLLFLERMYQAGAAPYFDIASAMVYGYGYSPHDRRVDFARNNFSRVLQTREIMVRYGDGNKPLWVSEYNWVAFPPDWRGLPSVWGRPVTLEQQARYLYEGYLRAQREWPWLGVLCVWYFRWWLPPDDPDNWADPTRGFAIVEWDLSPRPAYATLARVRPVLDRAWTGAYAATSRYWTPDAGWQVQPTAFGSAWVPERAGARLLFPFGGPRVDLTLLPGTRVRIQVDDRTPQVVTVEGTTPQRITVSDGLPDAPHRLTVIAEGSGGGILQANVIRRPFLVDILPWILGVTAAALALNLASLVWTFRRPASRTPVFRPVSATEAARDTAAVHRANRA